MGTLPRRGCSLREHILQDAQGKPIDSCICHQNRMETISVNIPFLDLAGNFPGKRAHSSFRTVENVWVTKYRLLSQPSLIPLLDGLYDRGTPAGREPNVEDIRWIQTNHRNSPGDRLSSSVYQASVLSLLDDCPLFCRSLSPTH